MYLPLLLYVVSHLSSLSKQKRCVLISIFFSFFKNTVKVHAKLNFVDFIGIDKKILLIKNLNLFIFIQTLINHKVSIHTNTRVSRICISIQEKKINCRNKKKRKKEKKRT